VTFYHFHVPLIPQLQKLEIFIANKDKRGERRCQILPNKRWNLLPTILSNELATVLQNQLIHFWFMTI
jgi:hypothetical protein